MGSSVNSRSWGASRMRALDRMRLMDFDERLPTKYPTLYVMMTAPLSSVRFSLSAVRWLIQFLSSFGRGIGSVRTTILPVAVLASSSAWARRISSSWYTRCRGTTASPAAIASRKA